MAAKTLIQLIDDMDGGEAELTITFGYEGKTYEIDLSKKNADKLHKAINPFVENARRVGGLRTGKPAAGKPSARNPRERLVEIREWARANGHQISDRGRISGEITAAYEAAH